MAINITYPAPSTMAKLKKFGFYAPKTANIDQVGGGNTYVEPGSSDVTGGSTKVIASLDVVAKTDLSIYFELTGKADDPGLKIRIIVDEEVVYEEDFPQSTTTIKKLLKNQIQKDNNTHTVKLAIYYSGSGAATYTIDKAQLTIGIVIDQTTETTIATISLPDYTLIDEGGGDFKYEVGVYVKADAIRRTSSDAYMNSDRLYLRTYSNDYSSILGNNVIHAGNDTDVVHIHLSFSYPSDKTLNLTGWVTNEGDAIIITNLYYQVCLVGNIAGYHNEYNIFISNAKGIHFITAVMVSLDGNNKAIIIRHDNENLGTFREIYSTSASKEVVLNSYMTNNMSMLGIISWTGEYYHSRSAFYLLEVVVVE